MILVTQKGLVTPESPSLVAMPGVPPLSWRHARRPGEPPLPRIPLGAPG